MIIKDQMTLVVASDTITNHKSINRQLIRIMVGEPGLLHSAAR